MPKTSTKRRETVTTAALQRRAKRRSDRERTNCLPLLRRRLGSVPAAVRARLARRFARYAATRLRLRAAAHGLAFDDALCDPDTVGALVSRPCHWCGVAFAGGVDRVFNDVGYVAGNVVPSCTACNMAKGAMHPAHFVGVSLLIATRGGAGSALTWGRARAPDFAAWLREASRARVGVRVRVRVRVGLRERAYLALCRAPCFFCATPAAHGLDRIRPDGPYSPGNVRPACAVCNWMRRASNADEFRARCARVAARHETAARQAAVSFAGVSRVCGSAMTISQ